MKVVMLTCEALEATNLYCPLTNGQYRCLPVRPLRRPKKRRCSLAVRDSHSRLSWGHTPINYMREAGTQKERLCYREEPVHATVVRC